MMFASFVNRPLAAFSVATAAVFVLLFLVVLFSGIAIGATVMVATSGAVARIHSNGKDKMSVLCSGALCFKA